jgi:exosome complex component MTR3
LFPKSTIDVFISVLENDGIESCVAAATVAASAALANAGIEMFGLVTACTTVSMITAPKKQSLISFTITKSIVENNIWLDPTEHEARLGRGSLMFACMPALDTITSIWQVGKMTSSEAIQVRKLWII